MKKHQKTFFFNYPNSYVQPSHFSVTQKIDLSQVDFAWLNVSRLLWTFAPRRQCETVVFWCPGLQEHDNC